MVHKPFNLSDKKQEEDKKTNYTYGVNLLYTRVCNADDMSLTRSV